MFTIEKIGTSVFEDGTTGVWALVSTPVKVETPAGVITLRKKGFIALLEAERPLFEQLLHTEIALPAGVVSYRK